jgi:hypothetical protein
VRRAGAKLSAAATLLGLLGGVGLAFTQAPLETPPAQADAPKPDPYGRPPPPTVPFGLSCTDCQYDTGSDCRDIKRADLIVEVWDLQPLEQQRDCETHKDPHYGNVRSCMVNDAVRFGHVRTLRGEAPAATSDIFFLRHEESGSTREQAYTGGLQLLPQSRYVLFARKTSRNARFGARWFGYAVCPSAAAHELRQD